MPLDQTANFLRATLSSAIASGDTTIDLSDSGQLVDPANGEYNLVVWDPSSYPRPGQDPAVEIVRATALDSGTDTLTVDRGQEGTTAADHAVEAVLQLSPTAKMFADIDRKTSALSDDGQAFAGDAIDVGSASVGSVNTDDIDITPANTGTTTIAAGASAIIGSDTSGYSQVFLHFADGGSTATVYAELREDFGKGDWQLLNDSAEDITIDWAIIEVADR